MPNVDEMWAGVQDALTARRVFGEPVEQDGTIVLPVASVRGGAGGGGDSEHNGGGGFGVAARPVGAWVIRGGDVRWQPAVDVNRLFGVAALIAFALLRRKR
jgi:uncharacterized spore protein YtfJ